MYAVVGIERDAPTFAPPSPPAAWRAATGAQNCICTLQGSHAHKNPIWARRPSSPTSSDLHTPTLQSTMPSSSQLPAFKAAWIQQALDAKALIFGSFTLKSGRQSPYFFNAGLLYSGPLLSSTAQSYASSLLSSPIGDEFDVLFGPAYKGIPLAAVTCMALTEQHKVEREYCYNRKEKKDHGEGGNMVGASMEGRRVVMIDDVLTSGVRLPLSFSPPCLILSLSLSVARSPLSSSLQTPDTPPHPPC